MEWSAVWIAFVSFKWMTVRKVLCITTTFRPMRQVHIFDNTLGDGTKGKVIGKSIISQPRVQTVCKPSLPVAGVGCCDRSTGSVLIPSGSSAQSLCRFAAEFTKAMTAEERCNNFVGENGVANNATVCTASQLSAMLTKKIIKRGKLLVNSLYRTSEECEIKLQVHRDGKVSIVDPLADAGEGQKSFNDKYKTDSATVLPCAGKMPHRKSSRFLDTRTTRAPLLMHGPCADIFLHLQNQCGHEHCVLCSVISQIQEICLWTSSLSEPLPCRPLPQICIRNTQSVLANSRSCWCVHYWRLCRPNGVQLRDNLETTQHPGGDNIFLMNKVSVVSIDGDESKNSATHLISCHFWVKSGLAWATSTFSIPQAEHEVDAHASV